MLLLLGASHVALYPVVFTFPVMLCNKAGLTASEALRLSQVSLVMLGVATILQALPRRWVGSGYLCPATGCPSYFSASLLAVKTGGLALMAGMVAVAGLFQLGLAWAIRRWRFLRAPEVMGLVALMLGATAATLAAPLFAGRPSPDMPFNVKSLAVASVTFLLMVVPLVRGWRWRRYSVLVGLAAGMVLSGLAQAPRPVPAVPADLPIFALPPIAHCGWAFDAALLLPFFIAALASSLKGAACIVACRQMTGEAIGDEAAEPVGKGVLALGVSNLLGGAAGSMGVSASAGNVGLSLATGVASRSVAWVAGVLLIVLGFSPACVGALLALSMPVLGACLLFVTCFMLLLAFRLLTAQSFDARRTFVLGMALAFGFGVDIVPGLFQGSGGTTFSDRLNLATIMAVGLSLLFQLGAPKAPVSVPAPAPAVAPGGPAQ